MPREMPCEKPTSKDCKTKPLPHLIPRGLLQYVVLRILQEHPQNGVEIGDQLSLHTGGEWSPSAGTLYPILANLERDGLIEVTSVSGRSKYYQVTEKSLDAMASMERAHQEISHRMHVFRGLWLHLIKPKERWKYLTRNIEANITALNQLIPSLDPKILKKLETRLTQLIQTLQATQSTTVDRE